MYVVHDKFWCGNNDNGVHCKDTPILWLILRSLFLGSLYNKHNSYKCPTNYILKLASHFLNLGGSCTCVCPGDLWMWNRPMWSDYAYLSASEINISWYKYSLITPKPTLSYYNCPQPFCIFSKQCVPDKSVLTLRWISTLMRL